MPRIISINRWRPVYELAKKIRALEPWQGMKKTDIFAVQDPASGKTGFISIMGMRGEHLAVGVYQGVAGLHGFMKMTCIGLLAMESGR